MVSASSSTGGAGKAGKALAAPAAITLANTSWETNW
jgi:hypothetical protein